MVDWLSENTTTGLSLLPRLLWPTFEGDFTLLEDGGEREAPPEVPPEAPREAPRLPLRLRAPWRRRDGARCFGDGDVRRWLNFDGIMAVASSRGSAKFVSTGSAGFILLKICAGTGTYR